MKLWYIIKSIVYAPYRKYVWVHMRQLYTCVWGMCVVKLWLRTLCPYRTSISTTLLLQQLKLTWVFWLTSLQDCDISSRSTERGILPVWPCWYQIMLLWSQSEGSIMYLMIMQTLNIVLLPYYNIMCLSSRRGQEIEASLSCTTIPSLDYNLHLLCLFKVAMSSTLQGMSHVWWYDLAGIDYAIKLPDTMD